MSNGTTCSESFKSQRALLAHQRKSNLDAHDSTRLFHQLSVSNRCINCKTSFRTSFEAGQHLTRAYHSGRCLRDHTHEIYEFVSPQGPLSCPICKPQGEDEDIFYPSYHMLEQHLATHLPVTLQGLPIRVVEPPPPSSSNPTVIIVGLLRPKSKQRPNRSEPS